MDLVQKILALLQTQFTGVRKDGLNQLARSLALQVDTEEQATEVVGKLTADKVNKFVSDWRKDADAEITKANKTYEDGLKTKYDFVEKSAPGAGTPPAPAPGGALDAEAIQKMMNEAVKQATQGLQAEIATLKGSAITANYREQLAGVFGTDVPEAYKNAVLEGFEGRQFADENAFNEFLNKTKEGVAAFTQELADKGLSLHEKPVFGTVNKDGVSTGVTSYLETKAAEAENKGLGGKEV